MAKGKTTSDLLKLDIVSINRMTRSELAKIVRTIGATANKRYARLGERGVTSTALKSLSRSGGRITTKDKSIAELKAEYIRAKQFLTAKTSTLTGYEEHKQAVLKNWKELAGKIDVDYTDTELDYAMSILDDLFDAYDDPKNGSPPKLLASAIEEVKQGGSRNEITGRIEKRLNTYYEERKSNTSVSDWFETE